MYDESQLKGEVSRAKTLLYKLSISPSASIVEHRHYH